MSLTEDLNVYRKMYDLLLKLTDARNLFDKPYKYVIGERLMNTALDCITLIHYANEDRRQGARPAHLDEFLIKFDILKTLIMVCRDRQQFKKLTIMADVFELVADVEAQATAWRRSSAKSAGKPEPQ